MIDLKTWNFINGRKISYLPIQDPPEQFPVNESLPTQYRPPFEGLGAVQVLVRWWRQSGPHGDHEVHADQCPSIAGK